MVVGEKVLSHCYFIATPCLLVEQRKMIFYNKTLHSNNIVLRIVYVVHRNEAHKLSSVPCITFFLDTRAVLALKGPFGHVL